MDRLTLTIYGPDTSLNQRGTVGELYAEDHAGGRAVSALSLPSSTVELFGRLGTALLSSSGTTGLVTNPKICGTRPYGRPSAAFAAAARRDRAEIFDSHRPVNLARD